VNFIKTISKENSLFNKLFLLGVLFVIFITIEYTFKVNLIFKTAQAPEIFRHKVVYVLYTTYINLFVFTLSLFILYPLILSINKNFNRFSIFLFCLIVSLTSIYNFFDITLFTIEGNHIYDDYVLSAICSKSFLREINLPVTTIYKIVGFIVFLLSLPYLIFWFFCKVRLPKLPNFIKVLPIVILLILTAFFYHRWQLLEISRTLPEHLISNHLMKKINDFDEEYLKPSDDIYNQYKDYKKHVQTKNLRKKNILIIHIESLRLDYDNDTYMPYLHSLAPFSTIVSKQSFSSSNTTEQNIFSLLYGLNSAGYNRFQEDSLGSIAFDVLKKAGYTTYGYSASSLKNWLKAGFIFKNFDQYTEFLSEHPYNDDSVMIEKIRQEYNSRDDKKPHFYYSFLVSTHHNYYYPPSFEKHKPVLDQNTDFYMESNALEQKKQLVINRYKNSVGYADYNVRKIIKIFEKEILSDNLILVITGDHGEEFWDKGLIGHSANNLYNCRINVPLVFHLPHVKPIIYNFTSNTEIMPTILDYLGLTDSKVFSFFDYQSLLRVKPDDERFILNTGCDFKNQSKACLITNVKKYWVTVSDKHIKINKEFFRNDTLIAFSPKDFILRKRLKQTIYLTYRYLIK